MVKLKLTKMPSSVYGIYGPHKNIMASRMLYLHPDAAVSFMRDLYPHRFRVSDMFRSADSSLQARHQKKGVQKPSWSGHNYGFSIDADLDFQLPHMGMDKKQFDGWMNERGWYCHRKDHLIEREAWHYNYFGAESAKYLAACAQWHSTAAGIEQKILDYYGSEFLLDPIGIQTELKTLKLYGGDIDGDIGPLSVRAIKVFQTAWDLDVDGIAGRDTQRLLSFLGSTVDLVPLPPGLLAP